MISPARIEKRPARVLMYTAYFEPEYSGAALQALTLARELRRRGHHIEFVTNRWPGLAAEAVVEDFAVHRLEPGRMHKHREFRLWLNLARYVWRRRRDFDILHSHGAYFTNAFVGPLARVLGLKSLVKASLADDDLQTMKRPLVGGLHRTMLRAVDAYMAISKDLANEFRAGGLRADKIHFVPNGVDTTRFQPLPQLRIDALRIELRLPVAHRIALYLGVLDQRKNVLWLAEQWIGQDAFGTDALLLLVGPQARDDPAGELRGRLADMAREHPNRIALQDFHPDVTGYYQCADVFVLPSAKEGLPNVVLEAMSCGIPCVVARASGSRELIVDGETGSTYTPDDASGLGRAVRLCFSVAGRAMGARARQLALQRYSIVEIADRYATLYANLTTPKRRVLYVENGIGYGGAIICLRHLVRNLDRTTYEPMVVTGLGDERYQDIANEARWKHIPDRRLDIISWKRALQAARWPDTLPGLRWVSNQVLARLDDLVNFLPSLAQTFWTVMRFRPDLIHVNNEPLCNRAAVLSGKLMGVPVVSHVRGDQQGSLLMQSFFRMPDYFIAVSRWVSDSIGRIGVPPQKRTYIYDGIELDKLDLLADGSEFRRRHGIDERAFVVGLVGLLIPWKGQRLFLAAARLLVRTHPDITFVIVGGAPDEFKPFEAELRATAADPALKGRVVFTGHVSDMASVYNGLDIVLSASTSPEPLGTMIIEAMTMARPVLAPDHGGAIEMVEDERTGLLFAAGDANDLAAKIRRLHDDPALRASLGAAARTRALGTFAVAEHVRLVQHAYELLLRPSSVGP